MAQGPFKSDPGVLKVDGESSPLILIDPEASLEAQTEITETRVTQRQHASCKEAPKSRAAPKAKISVSKQWLREVVCCVIAVIMILTTVAVLYPRRGLPLPQWPYSITINTLIAIYAVIMKVSILFVVAEGLGYLKYSWFRYEHRLLDLEIYDMASRGPWGSLILIWTLRSRYLVATIGAMVTVSAVAVDPFAQQILHYYSCSIVDKDAQATVPRTLLYDAVGQAIDPIFSMVGSDMQSAIITGLYNMKPPSVPVSCLTGNCTFSDTYHSLGMCSTCSNITYQLTTVFYDATSNTTTVYENGSHPEARYDWSGSQNISLPSGLFSYLNATLDAEYNSNDALFIMRPDLAQSYATIEVIFAWSNTNESSTPWAASCNFYPCVKSYTSSVHNGDFSERMVDGPFAMPGASNEGSAVDIRCLSPEQRRHLLDENYTITGDTRWILWEYGLTDEDPLCDSDHSCNNNSFGSDRADQIPMRCMYTFYITSWLALEVFLGQFFNGSITPLLEAFQGPSVLQTFYIDGNVTFDSMSLIFTNVAEAITTIIRQTGNSMWSQPAVGVTHRQDTCVHVRWGWLAFPVAVVALTISFLVFVILDSQKNAADHDWKSSLLPILFHGLEQSVSSEELLRTPQLRDIARETHVRFRQSGGSWKFVETE